MVMLKVQSAATTETDGAYDGAGDILWEFIPPMRFHNLLPVSLNVAFSNASGHFPEYTAIEKGGAIPVHALSNTRDLIGKMLPIGEYGRLLEAAEMTVLPRLSSERYSLAGPMQDWEDVVEFCEQKTRSKLRMVLGCTRQVWACVQLCNGIGVTCARARVRGGGITSMFPAFGAIPLLMDPMHLSAPLYRKVPPVLCGSS